MSEQDSTTTGTPGNVVPAEPTADDRRAGDRRRNSADPPGGIERRWSDRRRQRASEGRERYLDMVQRERSMFFDQGVSRSTEQLWIWPAQVAFRNLEEEQGIRDRATGDQLRSVLPVQAWLPLSIHLIGLRDGVYALPR